VAGDWELLVADYAHTGLSLREHPIAYVRRDLDDVVSSADLARLPNGARIVLPGLAIARQRPASANGVVFLLLEDEHGLVNLILMPPVYERFRLLARTEPLLLATGTLERRDRNLNVQVERLDPLETPGRRTIGPHHRDRTRRRPAAAAVQDLRAVAPPAMHFAQGRRRA
jgi:error-prone DNA polymerase